MMSAPATVASEQSLEGVIEDHWQWVLQQYPERRLEYGDRSGNGQWTDNSLAAFQQRYQDEGAFVARLEQIEPATLGHDARINRNMLMRQLRESRRRFEDGLHLIALDMRSGPQHWHSMIDYLPMETEQDYLDWLSRLRALPHQLANYQGLLREGITSNRTQAQIVMARVPAQIQSLLEGSATDSPFYKAFSALPPHLSLIHI